MIQVMLKPWHLSQLDAAVDLFNQSAKKLQRGNVILTVVTNKLDGISVVPRL